MLNFEITFLSFGAASYSVFLCVGASRLGRSVPRLDNVGFERREFGRDSEIARVRVNQHAVMLRVRTLIKMRSRSKKKISDAV